MTPLMSFPVQMAMTLEVQPVMAEVRLQGQEAFGVLRIETLGEGTPPWLTAVVARLRELGALQADWDGRGGQRLSGQDAQDVLTFLRSAMQERMPTPWIGILSSGGLQMAWRTGELEVEVVFDRSRGERGVVIADDNDEQELSLRQGLQEIHRLRDRLASGPVSLTA